MAAKVKIKKKTTFPTTMEIKPNSMIGANLGSLAGAVPSANLGSLAGAVPSANVGSLGGAVPSANIMGAQPVPQADNISQQKDIMEMQKAKVTAQMPQQQPVQQMVQKAKAKVKAKITEPLSAQSWVNMGNQPSEYQNYLAAWNEKFGKKAK